MNSKPAQEVVPIKEVRDGVVVLRDGTMCMVLMCSTLNFALKSEEEQNAILAQYQNFLNSLDFTIQFFIDSRKLDITPYLSSLRKAEKEQTNELLQIQIREYIDFIDSFVKTTNIVSKNFYVVVPFKSVPLPVNKGLLSSLPFFKKKDQGNQKDEGFEAKKLQLQQRVDVVQQGLAGCGIRAVALNTEELLELYYKLYNPGEEKFSLAKEGE